MSPRALVTQATIGGHYTRPARPINHGYWVKKDDWRKP